MSALLFVLQAERAHLLQSKIHPAAWSALGQIKLETLKLSTGPLLINGANDLKLKCMALAMVQL